MEVPVGEVPAEPLGPGLQEPSEGALGGEPAAPGGPPPPLEDGFAGIPYTFFFPPDPILAAGPSNLVAMVNGGIALFSKSGVNSAQRSLESFYNGPLTGTSPFDPRVLYDPHSGRFFAVTVEGRSSTASSYVRIAASKSSSPANLFLGSGSGDDWLGVDIRADSGSDVDHWADYPRLGVDQDNLYVTANMFPVSSGSVHGRVWIVPKAELLAGLAPTVSDFSVSQITVVPALNFDLSTEHMISLGTVFTVEDPAGAPSLSTAPLSLPAFPFGPPDCPQLGGAAPLDTLDTRFLHAVKRDGSLWVVHTIGSEDGARAEVRWYEIEPTGPSVLQWGEIEDPTRCYFFPALQPDADGNVVVVMSGVDSTIHGSAFYTARAWSDPPGTMREVAVLKLGEASYEQIDSFGRNRWGDYGGIAEDPATGEIWLFHEYASPVENRWGTWIGRVSTAGGFCGDASLTFGEECDDGNLIDGDGCDSNCTFTGCGNGIVTAGEECDDQGESAGCDADCTFALCGDGTRNGTAGEICDDGNLVDGDGCESDCSPTALLLSGSRIYFREPYFYPKRWKIRVASHDAERIVAPPLGSPGDPTLGGALLKVLNPSTGELYTVALPAGRWRAIDASGDGTGGYRYQDRYGRSGPCRKVLVRPEQPGRLALLRAVCRGDGIAFTLDEPAQGTLAVSLRLGTAHPYCMEFGGKLSADFGFFDTPPPYNGLLGLFARADAPRPARCEVP
jgi:cysteine-rich repeat protein